MKLCNENKDNHLLCSDLEPSYRTILYRHLLDNMEDAVMIYSYKGYFLDCNKAACNLLGYERDEFLSLSPAKIVHPDFHAKLGGKQTINTKEETFESFLKTKEGSLVPVRVISHTPVDFNGESAMITIVRDITEKKKSESIINEKENRLHAIFDYMLTGVAIIDEKTHQIVDINPAALKMINRPKHTVLGQMCHSFICPAEKGKCPISDLHQTVDNSERVLLGLDGKRIPILKTVATMNVNGQTYLVESFVDLTKQKKTEESLRESEERYRLIFDTANDIIVQMDINGVIVNINNKINDILGYTPQELIGKRLSDTALIQPEIIPKLRNILADLQNGKTGMNLFDLDLVHKNGATVNAEINTEIIRKNDAITGVLSIIRDITERKNAFLEKSRLEEKLRQSEKMEAIGQLAGGVAHDFNNQLACIIGFAELIKTRTNDAETIKHFAENIMTTAQRSADLTKQLLAFARKGKYRAIPVNIHKIIFEVITLLERSIDKKIQLMPSLKAKSSVVIGDPTQLQNAILNLALNARDAMPAGGELSISTDTIYLDELYCKSSPFSISKGYYVKICVTDTGMGIDPKIRKYIFEPFFTTKEVGRGTGMGLPAVYGTVTTHNGAVTLYSELGKGTTFTLYFPLTETETSENDIQFTDEPAITGNARILLIDDEYMIIEMAETLLKLLGYSVTSCKSGKEALQFYAKSFKDIDLVILDLIMPGMDGKETFTELKKINPAVKVLLSSGYSIDGNTRQLLDMGIRGFIQKPYVQNEFAKKIAEVLKE